MVLFGRTLPGVPARKKPAPDMGDRGPAHDVPHTAFTVVDIWEANMIITTIFVFVIAAAVVTWYVTTR